MMRRRDSHELLSEEQPLDSGVPAWAWIVPSVIVAIGVIIGSILFFLPSTSVVRIETDPPGASVSIDGIATSQSTPLLLEEVEEGRHQLRLTLEGYRSEAASFEATGDRVNLHYSLRREAAAEPAPAPQGSSSGGDEEGEEQRPPEAGRARLRITSQPPATIYVDDRPVGRTPLLGFEVAAGRHQLKLVSGRVTRRYRINVSSGETLIRSYRLR